MCGICGWYEARAEGAQAGSEPLLEMLWAMVPRGPDDVGHVDVASRDGGRWRLGRARSASGVG